MTTWPSSPSATCSLTGGDIGLLRPLTGLNATKSRGSRPASLISHERVRSGNVARRAGEGGGAGGRRAALLGGRPHDAEPRDGRSHLLGQPIGGVARLVVHGALSTDRAAQSLNSGVRFSLRAATAS